MHANKNRIPSYIRAALVLWTTLLLLSLWLQTMAVHEKFLDIVAAEAESAFNKDLLYGNWNAVHGGVYVPVTEDTPPDQKLSRIPERDITTPSGRKLTLMNPAYMTRQVSEAAKKTDGPQGRITSLMSISPMNYPDPWETKALKSLEQGAREVSSVETINGKTFMRVMHPLHTEKPCLHCHEAEGYKLGDIRGGLSISMPFAPLLVVEKSELLIIRVWHGFFWLLGVLAISLAGKKVHMDTSALMESRDRFRQIAENLDGVLWLSSPDYKTMHYVSPAYESLWGKGCESVYRDPRSWSDAIMEEDRRMLQINGGLVSPAVSTNEYRILRPDGTIRWIKDRRFPISDTSGKVYAIAGMAEDITAVKALETQRSDLYAMLRHDMKTPVSIIIGNAEMIINCADEKTDGILDMVMSIKKSARVLNHLLDDLAFMSRLESPDFTSQKASHDIYDLLLEIKVTTSDIAANKGLFFNMNVRDGVSNAIIDREYVRRAVLNIVDNAIKYTPAGGKIELCAGLEKMEGSDFIGISVSDTGPGIPAEEHERVFKKYYRSPRTSSVNGTGLGLAIVKAVAKAHGGKVELRSEVDKGSVFTLLLPL